MGINFLEKHSVPIFKTDKTEKFIQKIYEISFTLRFRFY